jgi:hypothetical protein
MDKTEATLKVFMRCRVEAVSPGAKILFKP